MSIRSTSWNPHGLCLIPFSWSKRKGRWVFSLWGFITIEDDHNWEESITSLLIFKSSLLNGPTIASILSARSQDWYIFPHREHRISMTLFRVKVLAMGLRENNPVGIFNQVDIRFHVIKHDPGEGSNSVLCLLRKLQFPHDAVMRFPPRTVWLWNSSIRLVQQ